MLQSGDVLEVSEEEAKVVDKVHTGEVLVDGLGVGTAYFGFTRE